MRFQYIESKTPPWLTIPSPFASYPPLPSRPHSVKVWDLGSSRCVHEFVPDGDVPIRSVSVGLDGNRLVCANQNAEVFVWSPSSAFKEVARFFAHETGYCIKCKMSPDCKTMVTTGSDRTARVWDAKTWELVKTLGQVSGGGRGKGEGFRTS